MIGRRITPVLTDANWQKLVATVWIHNEIRGFSTSHHQEHRIYNAEEKFAAPQKPKNDTRKTSGESIFNRSQKLATGPRDDNTFARFWSQKETLKRTQQMCQKYSDFAAKAKNDTVQYSTVRYFTKKVNFPNYHSAITLTELHVNVRKGQQYRLPVVFST